MSRQTVISGWFSAPRTAFKDRLINGVFVSTLDGVSLHATRTMASSDPLGRCPECSAVVYLTERVLQYDDADRSVVLTECEECRGVVAPLPIQVPSLDPS